MMQAKLTALWLMVAVGAACELRNEVESLVVFGSSPDLSVATASATLHVQALDRSREPLDGVRVDWIVPEGLVGSENEEQETRTVTLNGIQVGGLARKTVTVPGTVSRPQRLTVVASSQRDQAVQVAVFVDLVPNARTARAIPLAECVIAASDKPLAVRAQTRYGREPIDGLTVQASLLPNARGIRLVGEEAGVVTQVSTTAVLDGVATGGLVSFEVETTTTGGEIFGTLVFDLLGSTASVSASLIRVVAGGSDRCEP